MRRPLLTVLAVLAASLALVGFSSAITKQLCARQLCQPGDDLLWLRREFHLSGPELERIRKLHEGYLPKCEAFCARIAAKQKELQAALRAGPGLTAEAEQQLGEIGALRAQCQAQMLRHFHEVSQAMPPEEGRRYLAEMQRLTLGFHEQFERSMTGGGSRAHGNH